MKTEYLKLSDIQKIKFKELCGYEYTGDKLSGSFTTKRPYDKDWDLSPWFFSYVFQKDTGFLICELEHRMTNNRIFGWDYQGNELDHKITEAVFTPHF